jgi:hypothetical protein
VPTSDRSAFDILAQVRSNGSNRAKVNLWQIKWGSAPINTLTLFRKKQNRAKDRSKDKAIFGMPSTSGTGGRVFASDSRDVRP